MTDLAETAKRIKELAVEAAKVARTFGQPQTESVDCPMCGGDGNVDAVTAEPYEPYPLGVQYFGVGDDHVTLQAFSDAANPTAVLAILDELERVTGERETMRDGIAACGKALARAEAKVTALERELADLRVHIEGAWVQEHYANDPVSYGCRFCDASSVTSPNAEIRHDLDCPTIKRAPAAKEAE